MRKFICDKCKKDDVEFYGIVRFYKDWIEGDVSFELCKSCYKEFIRIVKDKHIIKGLIKKIAKDIDGIVMTHQRGNISACIVSSKIEEYFEKLLRKWKK